MALAVLCVLAPLSGLRLSKTMTSNMVVPADGPTFFGWAEAAGVEVSVRATDTNETVSVMAGADMKWIARLAEREASLKPFAVAISEKGEPAVMLTNLLAGDVWVCSGQSNMEFSVSTMFDRDEIIKAAGDQPGIRLFGVQKNSSTKEVDDVIDSFYDGGWVEASTETICGDEYGQRANYCDIHCSLFSVNSTVKRPTWGYFSAACYRHGLEVLRKTGRPQGLMASSWGGTSIQAWSSTAASAKCSSPAKPGNLWGGMIAPLLAIPITGVLWFQGEANSRTYASGNLYACQLPAMIQDWRARFAVLHNATTPFAWLTFQLAADGDSSGGALRLAQETSLQLPRTGMAVAIDLHDPTSPCHSVHFRNKSAAAVRLARATLDIVYGQNTAWTGPLAGAIAISADGNLTVDYNTTGQLSFITVPLQSTKGSFQNFQVTASASLTTGWVQAPATIAKGGSSVTVHPPSTMVVVGIRYGWGLVPYGDFLYDGEKIPARPFLATCKDGACTLIRGGDLPDDNVLYPEVEA